MKGPIGAIEDKAIETVSKMGWFKNITFGEVVLLLTMTALACGVYFLVPLHLRQIQDGYERIEKSHRESEESREMTREIVEKQRAYLIADAHQKASETLKAQTDAIAKQWDILEAHDKRNMEKLDEKDRMIRELIQGFHRNQVKADAPDRPCDPKPEPPGIDD